MAILKHIKNNNNFINPKIKNVLRCIENCLSDDWVCIYSCVLVNSLKINCIEMLLITPHLGSFISVIIDIDYDFTNHPSEPSNIEKITSINNYLDDEKAKIKNELQNINVIEFPLTAFLFMSESFTNSMHLIKRKAKTIFLDKELGSNFVDYSLEERLAKLTTVSSNEIDEKNIEGIINIFVEYLKNKQDKNTEENMNQNKGINIKEFEDHLSYIGYNMVTSDDNYELFDTVFDPVYIFQGKFNFFAYLSTDGAYFDYQVDVPKFSVSPNEIPCCFLFCELSKINCKLKISKAVCTIQKKRLILRSFYQFEYKKNEFANFYNLYEEDIYIFNNFVNELPRKLKDILDIDKSRNSDNESKISRYLLTESGPVPVGVINEGEEISF